MTDYPVYTRKDGTQFTGLRDHHGTSTPLMTDIKYNAIAAELAKPENRVGAKVIEDMAKAEAEALKAKKPFSQDGFLAKSPAGADGRAFLAKMQVDHGAQAENIADVMADRRKPAGQRLGEQRAVSVGVQPTLPQNVAVAERLHAGPPERPAASAPRSTSFAAKGIVGKIAAGAAGLAAAGMASAHEGQSMQHHAARTVDAMLPTNLSGEKTLCQQFGEVATSVASAGVGIGVGLLATPAATPLGGIAAGLATQEVVGQAGSKLTQLVCGR